jgi:hypothetical protein
MFTTTYLSRYGRVLRNISARSMFCTTHPKLVNQANIHKLAPTIDLKMLTRTQNCVTKEMSIHELKNIVLKERRNYDEIYCKLKHILDIHQTFSCEILKTPNKI